MRPLRTRSEQVELLATPCRSLQSESSSETDKLLSYLVIVQLIASTTTDTGLTVACQLDASDYEKGIRVSDAEMASLNIEPASFHGEWNYTISPRRPDG